MIDTHCHLTDLHLLSHLDDVLSRAADAGVDRMITIGTSSADGRACIELSRRFSHVRCAVGLHPNYVTQEEIVALDGLEALQAEPEVLALGEMGLDYHHHFAPPTLQAKAFEKQLHLAAKLGKPVVIHCREAIDDTLAIMSNFSGLQAVFHCFTGSANEGRRVLDAGYVIGFTGVVTFKNSTQLQEVARFVPEDRFVVETDAPYLSPEPMRKVKVNEPAFVMHTAAAVAQLRGVSVDEVDRLTTANARRFFRWP
jgi:TatD DNase family protein